MANLVYKPNKAGVRKLMRSREMQSLMVETARDIAAKANQAADNSIGVGAPLYDAGPIGEPVTGQVSAHGFVRTANLAAMIDQAYNDTLSRLI